MPLVCEGCATARCLWYVRGVQQLDALLSSLFAWVASDCFPCVLGHVLGHVSTTFPADAIPQEPHSNKHSDKKDKKSHHKHKHKTEHRERAKVPVWVWALRFGCGMMLYI